MPKKKAKKTVYDDNKVLPDLPMVDDRRLTHSNIAVTKRFEDGQKIIVYDYKVPAIRIKHINRPSHEDSNLQGFIQSHGIRGVVRVEMDRIIEPDNHGFVNTKFTITYKGE